jgi:hypothetical protein
MIGPAPRYANEHAFLLKGIETVLAECEANFPAWVTAGKMKATHADSDLATLRAIVADWRRIVALREGRPAELRQEPDDRFVKRRLLRFLLTRERQQLARDREEFCATLPKSIVADIKAGRIDRAVIWQNWKARTAGFNFPIVGVLFDRERRFNAIDALAWHADHWPRAMDLAETQASLAERDTPTPNARIAA